MAGVFHHADAAQIPQHGTDGLRRAFLVYMRRFAGIDAECVWLPDLPVIIQGRSVDGLWRAHDSIGQPEQVAQ